MKQLFTVTLFAAMLAFFVTPHQTFAASDTLVVYATKADHSANTLDVVFKNDTLANGNQAHGTYLLVSRDTTYLFDGTISVKSSISVVGVLGSDGRPPCIQPDVLGDNSVPGLLFSLNGNHTTGKFSNLYLLGIAVNNTVNYGSGQAIQISADTLTLWVNNVIFEQWSQFAIGYAGNWDKFFITNCKFRNMTTLPNQYYVGEVLRNENYLGSFRTDTTILRYNTMLCVSGYATAATGGIVSYYEFSHNDVVWTFKNPFFLDRMVNAKFDNNIFYGAYTGGDAVFEYTGGWDSFTASQLPAIIAMGPLDSLTAARLLGHASTGPGDPAAELLRKVEVKNNDYFWPAALTSFYTAWDDTAHVDSIITPVWMTNQSVAMFNSSATPGFVQSGNVNIDPGFGATIPGVLNSSSNANGVGLLNWFTAVRAGTGTTETYGYKLTQVTTAANWVPTWPLPETVDLKATASLTSTDGRPVGDPYWTTGTTSGVANGSAVTPKSFTLSEAYPNPFNPSTNVQYTLSNAGVTSLKVYNVLGQLVKTVVDNVHQDAGTYTVRVDMSTETSGVYFYTLEQGANRLVHKMMLLK
ncbi:MAG TPA: T9SS type A sorting domain-containing protein [Bacteroidota bacterium]|nr:T9SS type A sorting domain-containing protein [Bacteroidota bacterium]